MVGVCKVPCYATRASASKTPRAATAAGNLSFNSFCVATLHALSTPLQGYQGKRIDNTSVRDEPYEFVLGGDGVSAAAAAAAAAAAEV
jgi:hypothetical protein